MIDLLQHICDTNMSIILMIIAPHFKLNYTSVYRKQHFRIQPWPSSIKEFGDTEFVIIKRVHGQGRFQQKLGENAMGKM